MTLKASSDWERSQLAIPLTGRGGLYMVVRY
jgi:hypothetical protein